MSATQRYVCNDPVGAANEIDRLRTRLAEVAEIAHNGGCDMTEGDALIAIRRLTLPHWKGATGSAPDRSIRRAMEFEDDTASASGVQE